MKLDFSGIKILVIGDPMIDRYIFGHVDRVSPEAPVPVFIGDKTEIRWGGAANVLAQLTALGCEAKGAWNKEEWWWEHEATNKTRYMVGSHQLLRVDHDKTITNTIPSLNGFHAIAISDYAKGACTPEICQEAIKSGLPVIVDPKGSDWSKYKGASLICPNEKEMAERTDETWFAYRLVKMGSKGLSLLQFSAGHFDHFPAHAKAVFDVTGCGDVVVAVMAACVAKGIDRHIACKLANEAAGYAAGVVGTAVCPLDVLCAYAETL